ncbi:MAG: tRNA dimethylallyltransferase [Myxococcota bacterium]|jgi:tRNA dimethylallyltransferase
MRPLIIGGPTAAGKSDLALQVAERFGARIVSADAMTVYRYLDIGTAKPPPEVLAAYPHDCVDVRDPDGDFTVEDFAEAVQEALAGDQPVVIAGGTPFYLAALLRPLPVLPPGDPEVRVVLELLEDPHALLREQDPIMAERLHPNDRVRVIRALEVIALTGEKMSIRQAAPPRRPVLDAEVVWLDRDGLRDRIEQRLSGMLSSGYVEEVEGLLAAGWGAELKPMRSFSYRHLVAHVQGGLELEDAARLTGRDTWRLARKQRSWARSMGWEPAGAEAVMPAAERAYGRRRGK